MLGFRYANRLSLAFAGTPDHVRRKEGSHFMLPGGVDVADPTDVSEPVRRRELVCGPAATGFPLCGPLGAAPCARPSIGGRREAAKCNKPPAATE